MEPEPKQGRLAIIRRLRRTRRELVVVDLVQDFAQNSTLHGLRYVAERKLSIAERVFWILAFMTSLSLCAMLISNVWVKWQSSPIIVTLGEQLVSISEVPFPAVTICPQSKVKQSIFNFSVSDMTRLTKRRNWTPNEVDILTKFEAVSHLCGLMSSHKGNDSDAKLMENVLEVAPDKNDVFEHCFMNGNYISCDTLFSPVLTKDGVCFTMNTLAADEILRVENVKNHGYHLNTSTSIRGWSFSEGYYSTNDSDVYPKRGRSNDGDPYLDITLTANLKERFIECNTFDDGFKVYLHHPADMPQSSVYYSSALLGEAVSLAVKLTVLNTSRDLKDYPSEKRQCYFPEERQLRYFRSYTARNCRLECQSNFTFEYCDCVGFYMPYDNNSTICRRFQRFCLTNALERYADSDVLSQTEVGTCHCLPLCNDIQYEAEILKSKYNVSSQLEHLKKQWGEASEALRYLEYTRLQLYYKARQFPSMQRSELFGLTDFLANCGGLLGLFLGFSFLSLVEIVYFLTLRLGCALRRVKQHPDTTTANKEKCSCPCMK